MASTTITYSTASYLPLTAVREIADYLRAKDLAYWTGESGKGGSDFEYSDYITNQIRSGGYGSVSFEILEFFSDQWVERGLSYSEDQVESGFFHKLAQPHNGFSVHFGSYATDLGVTIESAEYGCKVEVNASLDDGPEILAAVEAAIRPLVPVSVDSAEAVEVPFVVFLGHGGDLQWLQLRERLREEGFDVDAFEGRPNAGQSINSVLEGKLDEAAVGVMLLTGEDVMESGTKRGRQNVVHEIGLFQGRLGWDRAIIVAERGVELFSNLNGTVRIEFEPGNVDGAVTELVRNLRAVREVHTRMARTLNL